MNESIETSERRSRRGLGEMVFDRADERTREPGSIGSGRRSLLRGGRFLCIAAVVALLATGCATKGDFRQLEERVLDQHRGAKAGGPDPFERIAALSKEVEALREAQRQLEGRLEVAEKAAADSRVEARKARESLAGQAAGGSVAAGVAAEAAVEGSAPDAVAASETTTSAEVEAYQGALSAWRGKDHQSCIDRFRKFLQTYPASAYADDAAYWMADCHFKQGDYRVAVLRFNDVVRVYPAGNKAPDALYRQGESLLKLGPGFHDAARTVFEQVLKEYPDSPRAAEAKKQLEVIRSG